MNQTTLSVIDAGVLVHQIPGGMDFQPGGPTQAIELR